VAGLNQAHALEDVIVNIFNALAVPEPDVRMVALAGCL